MAPLFDKCLCSCHTGSVLTVEAPEVSDPIAALTACDRCAVLHLGVWTVVARGPATEGNTNSEGDE